MFNIYLATYSIDIVALLFLLWLLHDSNMLILDRKKPFLSAILLTIIIILAEAGTILAGESVHLRGLNILCNIIGFALTPIIPIALVAITNIGVIKTHQWILLLSVLNVMAAGLSPFFNLIFNVNKQNQYSRGFFFFYFVTVYCINLLFLVISTLRTAEKYRYPMRWKMIALSLFTVFGTSIQLANPLAYSSWHCVTLSMFLYFLFLSEFDGSFDILTGLYNRASYEKMIEASMNQKKISVIILDIDDFKHINDTYGHDYGDAAIREVASIIRESFDNHLCYRIGGDEFCIVSKEVNRKKIERRLVHMTHELSERRRNDNRLPTVSYGYSVFHGEKNLNFQEILKQADSQMYYYKKCKKLAQKENVKGR